MCGICGVYDFNGENSIDRSLLRRMGDVLTHRGPNDEGYFLDDRVGIASKRLSIIDILGGHQPIHNEDESIWIVFNGIIYNYKEIRRNLEDRNHRFYTTSDTEVIVHSYEEFGNGCVKKFNGMFAFAIWDSNEKKLLLARDRIGIKPLHYAIKEKRLIFGSEIKSILQFPNMEREVDFVSLHHFLGFEYVPSPRTMFKGIKKLSPGHILECKEGEISVKKYWDLKFSHNKKELSYYSDQTFNLLKNSVEKRLISEVPIGAILSGGIDSSSVVGLMSGLLDRPIKTFSIGFEEESYNELKYARLIADHFGTEHHEEIVGPNAVDLVHKIIQLLDEPFADVSVFPTYLVYELAKKEATVVLSGDGGDELFAGYNRYIASRLDRYYSTIPHSARSKIQKIIESIPPTPSKAGFINEMQRFVFGSSFPPEGRQIRWQYFITKDEREELYSNDMRKLKDTNSFDLINEYYSKINTAGRLSKEQYVDIKMYLPDDILTKVDRMSMANSIEARVPFLDHRFVEFTATIPDKYKLHRLTTKYILKKSMSKLLPKEIINRKKQGFDMPMKNWLRDDLKFLMLDVLSKERIQKNKYFNYDYVNKIIQLHLKGKRNYAHQIWALITFELWREKYIN